MSYRQGRGMVDCRTYYAIQADFNRLKREQRRFANALKCEQNEKNRVLLEQGLLANQRQITELTEKLTGGKERWQF